MIALRINKWCPWIPSLSYSMFFSFQFHTINLLERTSLGPLDTVWPPEIHKCLAVYIPQGHPGANGLLAQESEIPIALPQSGKNLCSITYPPELPIGSDQCWNFTGTHTMPGFFPCIVLISLPFPVSPELTSSVSLPCKNSHLRFSLWRTSN